MHQPESRSDGGVLKASGTLTDRESLKGDPDINSFSEQKPIPAKWNVVYSGCSAMCIRDRAMPCR